MTTLDFAIRAKAQARTLAIYRYGQASQITKLPIVTMITPLILMQDFGVTCIGWNRLVFMAGKLVSFAIVPNYFQQGNFRRNVIVGAWGRTLPWLLLLIPTETYGLHAFLTASFLDGFFCSLDILCQVDNSGLDYMAKDFGVEISPDQRVKELSFYSMYIAGSFLVITVGLSTLMKCAPELTTSFNYKVGLIVLCILSSIISTLLYMRMGKVQARTRIGSLEPTQKETDIRWWDTLVLVLRTPTIIWRQVMNILEVGWMEVIIFIYLPFLNTKWMASTKEAVGINTTIFQTLLSLGTMFCGSLIKRRWSAYKDKHASLWVPYLRIFYATSLSYTIWLLCLLTPSFPYLPFICHALFGLLRIPGCVCFNAVLQEAIKHTPSPAHVFSVINGLKLAGITLFMFPVQSIRVYVDELTFTYLLSGLGIVLAVWNATHLPSLMLPDLHAHKDVKSRR
ncbi:Hypothetical protein POVN_LOCUS619 [uncultured virus]|nr:Hypothetical protein POVN_LOCUS619 [uncultured virus]